MPKKKGYFIVIDGIDGAGKATQTKKLFDYLKKQKVKVETIDFPQYNNNFFGSFIGECLTGKHGDFLALNPRIASVLYAADRLESSKKIHEWLKQGRVVISDRFVSSNQIHQGGKCKSDKERKEFLKWLDTMEHGVFGIPRPDAIVYLSLPVSVSRDLLSKQKGTKEGNQKKKYLKGAKDVVEESAEYFEASRKSAFKIIKELNNWHEIQCFENGSLHTIEEIHNRVVSSLYPTLKKIIKNKK